MSAMKHLYLIALIGLSSLIFSSELYAQCQILDQAGNPSTNPVFIGKINGTDYCSGDGANDTSFLFNLISAANYGPYTILWGDGDSTTGTTLNQGAFQIHSYTTIKNGSVFAPDTFYFTFKSAGCVINGKIAHGYQINANIGVPSGLGTSICAPGTLILENNTNQTSGLPVNAGTQFIWTWGDGTTDTRDHTSAGTNISHTYLPTTVTCQTVVELEAIGLCNTSRNTQDPVYIWDLDVPAIAASATTLCYPDTIVAFSNGSFLNCINNDNTSQRYEFWNFGQYWGNTTDSTYGFRTSRQPIPAPAPNPINIGFPGIGTYTVQMIDSNFCGQIPTTIDINIVPPPIAAAGQSDDTICAGQSVTFQNLSTGGADEFAWDFGDGGGFQASGNGNQIHTYATPGTYTIRLAIGIAGSTCRDTVPLILEVLLSPTADIGLDNAIGCDSLYVNFTDSSVGTIIAWNWDFGNSQTSAAPNPGLQFYGSPANYPVSLTVTNNLGCDNTDNEIIRIYQTPVPDFTPTSICANEIAQFMDLTASAPGDPVVSWIWNFGDGSPTSGLQNPTHTYAAAGNYDITLTVSTANCMASDTTQIVVEQLPNANFLLDVDSGCSPLSVNFINLSSANSVSYLWDFGDGDTSTQTAPNHVFTNNFGVDTNYTIRLVAYTNFGCSDTVTRTVDVFPVPLAQFTDNSQLIKCSPAVIAFVNQSIGGATSYLWDFGNGNTSTQTNPSDTFVNNFNVLDTFTVSLVAFSNKGCSDTASQDYIVFPKPSSLPAVIDSGCSQLTVNFPPVVGAVNYVWDFGDFTAGTGPTPTHTYTNNDTITRLFTVELRTSSAAGCKDTSTGIVKVYHLPDAQIIANQTIGCQPLLVNFNNLSQHADFYNWDFDDGVGFDTTNVNISHTFTNTADTSRAHNVVMTAKTIFGCTTADSVEIRVHPSVTAAFIHDTAGCSPFGAAFTNTSSAAASIWSWTFGDGGNSTNKDPIYAYIISGNAPDTFNIQLIASSVDNCSDTAFSAIVVYPSPNANFSINPSNNTLTYPDTVFGIQNLDLNWSYIWDFGDGDSSTAAIPGTKGYTGWGNFIITLIAYNDFCQDTAVDTVTILPPLPIANFGETTTGCEDLTVEFINRSKYAINYNWKFINGSTNAAQSSADKDPIITFTDPGLYNVILVVTGEGGSDEKIEIGFIEVFEQPMAAFTVAPAEVFVPNEKIVCFNNSRGENLGYAWDFGDGSSSNQENPEHYYQAEGVYTIALVATNGQCSDTAFSDSPVLAKPTGNVEAPNAFTPRGGSEPGSNGGLDVNSPGYDRQSNDIFFPKIVGQIKDYEFMIFNKWGELLFRTDKQSVGWTGWYRHRLCRQDVYVFKVKATMVDNSEKVLVGDVTLLR